MMRKLIVLLVIGLVLSAVYAAEVSPRPTADASRPGEVTLEAPTIVCLGVRWTIQGDANHNARIETFYRKSSEEEWKKGRSLFRVESEALREKLPLRTTLFAGSIFDLEPDTEYELRLGLSDPDGGSAERVVKARTLAEPTAPEPLRTLYVVPGKGGGKGTKEDPFRGLAAANEAARPGDLILLGPGVYKGTFTINKSGAEGKPIVWRGPGDGEAIIDGQGASRGISAGDLHHIFLENLTVRNARWGIAANRSSYLVVRRCHIHKVDYGFVDQAHGPPVRNVYIADNLIEGPSTWPRTKGIEAARGIQIVGEGIVVCYNRIRGFADGIDIFSKAPCNAIDFYNNEISECTDDGIEMDYGQQNVRCFRNRLTNCFQGISTQPLYGGPCYIFRNAMYNIQREPFKMHNRPSGILMLHNTSVKAGMPLSLYTSEAVHRAIFRNNLFLGTQDKYAMEFTAPMVRCDFDYDGFGGGPFKTFAKWNKKRYSTFKEFRTQSPIERHAVLVNPATAFKSGLTPPRDYKKQFPISINDLRLRSGCAAIDAGQVLPNINDGFAGRAPDLGAYELGDALPYYGPR